MTLLHLLFYATTFLIHWQKTSFHNWLQKLFIVKLCLTPCYKLRKLQKSLFFGNYQDSQKYKFCKLTLVDGDNHIIHCRLSVHFSNDYNHLKKLMFVRLDRCTPLRYRFNDFSQLIQAIFVSKFTVIGHNYLSQQIDKFPLFVNYQSFKNESESKPPS